LEDRLPLIMGLPVCGGYVIPNLRRSIKLGLPTVVCTAQQPDER
jgi:hypothetical protein